VAASRKVKRGDHSPPRMQALNLSCMCTPTSREAPSPMVGDGDEESTPRAMGPSRSGQQQPVPALCHTLLLLSGFQLSTSLANISTLSR